ncbi:MAG: hypothetical protein WCJ95_20305 [Mariniphaga sp.]
MNIQFTVDDQKIHDIRELLISNMNLPENILDTELNGKLNDLAKAAFFEYIEMIVGSGVPTKLNDIMLNRMIFLIDYYYNKFPNETEISRIFNVQTSRGRSLVNSLKATKRNKLSVKIRAEIITFLQSGIDLRNNKWEFEIKSRPIIQELNELIALKEPGKEKFKLKADSSAKVTLHVDSYTFLKTEFQIP